MADKRGFRRRNFLVRRSFQFRFLALLLLQMSIILAALGLLVYSHVDRIAVIADGLPLLDADSRLAMQNDLLDTVHVFYARALLLIGATATMIMAFGLLASHKLAGPVVKLENYINAVADGDYSQRIAFRRADNLDTFARSINAAVEAIEQRRLESKELAIVLARKAKRLDDSAQRETVLAEMNELLAGMRSAV